MTAAPERYRYRLRFGKTGAMRWTGHLDLQKNIERMFRRAKLPMWYTKGFHPRPRLVFASALPLGQSSHVELMDLWLREELPAEEMLARLTRAAHPDLPLYALEQKELSENSLTVQLQAATYRALLLPPSEKDAASVDVASLRTRIHALLEASELPRKRRGKDYDLRPLIEKLELEEDGDALTMQLKAREGQNGRAEEVLLALDLDPADCRIERTALVMTDPTEQVGEALR